MTIASLGFRADIRPGDAAAVRALVAATGFFVADEVEIAVELVEKGAADDYYFVFADEGDRLAGYVCYGPIDGTDGRYDLYWIVVDPARQRGGLGKMLMARAEAAIRQAGGERVYVETSTTATYAPTRGFYYALGYDDAATLADFYRKGDGKLILMKELNLS